MKIRQKKATVLRAISYNEDGNYGKELIETYFVGLQEYEELCELPTLSIIIEPDSLFGYENGIYIKGMVYNLAKEASNENPYLQDANYRRKGKGWRREAIIQAFGDDWEYKNTNEVQISIHGGHSRAYSQKSFNIFSNSTENELFEIFGNNFSSLVLKATGACNNVSNIAPKLRDYVNQLLITSDAFLKQNGTPYQLFINGEYWGVYSLINRIDADYIAKSYGVNEADIEIVKYNAGEIELISSESDTENEFLKFVDYINSLDLSSDEAFKEIENQIDVVSLIDYYAYELYMNNTDWLGEEINNYAVWRCRTETTGNEYADGKWRYIMYDVDSTASVFGNQNYDDNPFFNGDGSMKNIYVLSKLFENKSFVKRFCNRFLEIIEADFNCDRIKTITENEFVKYGKSMIESQKRFYDENYSQADFEEEINVYIEFYKNRGEFMKEYINDLYMKLGGN